MIEQELKIIKAVKIIKSKRRSYDHLPDFRIAYQISFLDGDEEMYMEMVGQSWEEYENENNKSVSK